MRPYILAIFLLVTAMCSYAQNINKRIILIGDAGEINHKQSSLLHKAAELIKVDSTLMFFLGDNIYPSGMGLEGIEKEEGIKSLQSQFEPFRQARVPVFFLAGNHDWNVSRPGGLEKLKAQEDYLASQNDPEIKLIPTAGDPGPVRIPVTKDFIIIAYDSEYWLYPYHPKDENLIEKRVLFNKRLAQLFAENKDKTILVLSHHPMITYGEHSLKFGWKQHIFPLTRLKKNLYLPLPVLGSIYPLWRGYLFNSAEDLPSKKYQQLVKDVLAARGDHPHVLFAAGHDHGLQFIETEELVQVVSGSGSKSSFIINDKHLKFKFEHQGFCILDYLDDGNLKLTYYTFDGTKTTKAYETIIEER